MYTAHYHYIQYAHNAQAHMLIFTEGGNRGDPGETPRSIGENNTSNKLNSHMVSAELEPVTRTLWNHSGERRRVSSVRHPCYL
jgi:hypothetical protein